jgi:hypothetical protein
MRKETTREKISGKVEETRQMSEYISQTQLVNAPYPATPSQSTTTLGHHTETVKPLLTSCRPAADIPLLRTQGISEPA